MSIRPSKEAAKEAASASAAGAGAAAPAGPAEVATLGVTEIVSGSRFFVQRTEDDRANRMFQQLQELTPAEESKTFEPKKGALIAGKFTGDDNWYRAIVTENRSGAAPVKVGWCKFILLHRLLLLLLHLLLFHLPPVFKAPGCSA